MEKLEDRSTNWDEARLLFETKLLSARKIAQMVGTSHTALLKRAKSERWTKFKAVSSSHELRIPVETAEAEARAKAIADADPRTLQNHGRLIIQRLMSELEAAALRGDELEMLIEQDFAGRTNARRRAALLKLLTYESRAKTANYLATALARLTDAQPVGKKEQAQIDAENAGRGGDSEWGDDLLGPRPSRLAN